MTLDRRCFLGAATGLALSAPAQAAPTPPLNGVLELFTSQGCSSCPPADLLFLSLSREPGLLALSLPVTIWDHLGWKDTLAKTVFSKRQKAYALARGDRRIYTPQAVINGVAHAVGSDAKAIEEARKDSLAHTNVLFLRPTLTRTQAGWQVEIPGLTDHAVDHATIMLAAFEREHTVTINRGENTGRTIRYGNVVRTLTRLGDLGRTAMRLALPEGQTASPTIGLAVLVQGGTEEQPGAMLGAIEVPRG
ncbi:MAG: DUF1223 domain-containing protein [Proteobacteria bacterium]|nr:DUF1223 domain-containing protein [Pseudomonadota bacterium]